MSKTYDDLVKRARRLIKSEASIPSLEWEKEAHAVKTQARKAYAMGCISHDEMCRIQKMIMEAEYE